MFKGSMDGGPSCAFTEAGFPQCSLPFIFRRSIVHSELGLSIGFQKAMFSQMVVRGCIEHRMPSSATKAKVSNIFDRMNTPVDILNKGKGHYFRLPM
ncbi:hypothetical protein U1Q18_009379 [Sarracenia purpurea var. burkii]